ncbi:helix-turn-helix transcriptional regulator [Steroidobacter sp.]|uniref:helix-turn-helix transcriptional regulator n=1 Tax=Steroidobacter sp. TaxID=1978227 RepID=UPI001A53B762|nr:LuxR family transcriptional regulator [Steroidobacter sp.]MBL8268546.1 LuxR family transcriptional regulator [Steroidobacter sp.]
MDPFDWTQLFIERCEHSLPAPALTATFQQALEHMGFRHFACCSHVDPNNPPQSAVVLHNYPDAWAGTFAERKLYQCDPVFQRAERSLLPFRWNTPEFNALLTLPQKRILQEAASVGIAHGYTVPIHLPWTAGAIRASCSVIPDSDSIDERAYRAVQVMATYLYAAVGYHQSLRAARENSLQATPVLSVRERQCLELAAQGKTDWDISQLLGISENTVHKHIESAKRRLGVSTRIQAVVWAVQHREICFGDVVQLSHIVRTRRPMTH